MLVTENSFPWLRDAEEQRVARQLERRRVAAERAEDAARAEARRVASGGSPAPAERVPRRLGRLIRRMSAAGGTM